VKWELDQSDGYLGWSPPKKGQPGEQPRWLRAFVDIEEIFAEPQTSAVLEAWHTAKLWSPAPPFSGGVLDAWPAVMVDGLAICRDEARAIAEYLHWKEAGDGPDPSVPR